MASHRNLWRGLSILASVFLAIPAMVSAGDDDEVSSLACKETNLGPLPGDQKFAGRRLKQDWAQDMKPGDAAVRNRVFYRVISATKVDQPALTDAQRGDLGYPPAELVRPIPVAEKSVWSKREAQRMSLVDWIVDRDYGFLPAAKKDALRKEYRQVAKAALTIDRRAHSLEKSPPPNRELLTEMNNLLAKLVILDRDAYKNASQEIQKAHFRRALTKADYAKTQTEIAKNTARFVSGDYLIADKLRQLGTRGPSPSSGEARVERTQLSGPDWLALEGRVFVAEHPVFDWWEAGIEHSSILAGRWGYAAQTYLEDTYRIAPPPAGAETEEQARARLQGTLVSRAKVTEEGWKFLDWVWANGAAGSYQVDDELNLVEVIRFASDTPYLWQDTGALDIALGSYTPTSDGTYCRNRATSYATGLYGFDFVCHQIANAFMYHRRDMVPVYHWYSWLLYGVTGNQDISECSTWAGKAMHGCIPGNWCAGNHIPYTLAAISSGVSAGSIVGPAGAAIAGAGVVAWEFIFEAAPGDGYGLERVWNQKKDAWIWSEAAFNNTAVTLAGPDDAPVVRTVEVMPLG